MTKEEALTVLAMIAAGVAAGKIDPVVVAGLQPHIDSRLALSLFPQRSEPKQLTEGTPQLTLVASPSGAVELPKKRQRPKGQVDPQVVLRVFAYWRERCDHPDARMTPHRSNAIGRMVSQGYTEAEIKRAIDGAAASEFHQGTNDRGKKFDDITLICRDGSYLERFWEHADEAPSTPSIVKPQYEERARELRAEMSAAQKAGDHARYERANRALGELLQRRPA